MEILVTGGLGYIGSHTVVELLKNNYNVVIVDDLSNSSVDVLDKIKQITGKTPTFYKIDIKNTEKTEEIFKNHSFEAIIHFAGYKVVSESVTKPLMYYENNLMTTIIISNLCLKYNVNKFIFSSSANVYGDNTVPFKEDMALIPTTNPYGETKVMCEKILTDVAKVNDKFSVSLLRYFNPIGAEENGLLSEKTNGVPSNIMPYICEVARGNQEKVLVFGDDYNTKDGTGVRDYIHVVDLAIGHVLALKNIKSGSNIYNLGTGHPVSVLELIKSFEKVHNISIPYEVVGRRYGDIAVAYADCTKAEKELGFKTKYNILDMCKHAYKA